MKNQESAQHNCPFRALFRVFQGSSPSSSYFLAFFAEQKNVKCLGRQKMRFRGGEGEIRSRASTALGLSRLPFKPRRKSEKATEVAFSYKCA